MSPYTVRVLGTEFLPCGFVLNILLMKAYMIGSGWDVAVWMKVSGKFLLLGGNFMLQQVTSALACVVRAIALSGAAWIKRERDFE